MNGGLSRLDLAAEGLRFAKVGLVSRRTLREEHPSGTDYRMTIVVPILIEIRVASIAHFVCPEYSSPGIIDMFPANA